MISGEDEKMSHVVEVISASERYPCADGKNSGNTFAVEAVRNCYIFQIDFKKDVEMLRKPTVELVAEDETFS